jgi:hypothetical protein
VAQVQGLREDDADGLEAIVTGKDSSEEPMTPLIEACSQAHEFFLALTAGEFTEMQALYILGVMLATNSKT